MPVVLSGYSQFLANELVSSQAVHREGPSAHRAVVRGAYLRTALGDVSAALLVCVEAHECQSQPRGITSKRSLSLVADMCRHCGRSRGRSTGSAYHVGQDRTWIGHVIGDACCAATSVDRLLNKF